MPAHSVEAWPRQRRSLPRLVKPVPLAPVSSGASRPSICPGRDDLGSTPRFASCSWSSSSGSRYVSSLVRSRPPRHAEATRRARNDARRPRRLAVGVRRTLPTRPARRSVPASAWRDRARHVGGARRSRRPLDRPRPRRGNCRRDRRRQRRLRHGALAPRRGRRAALPPSPYTPATGRGAAGETKRLGDHPRAVHPVGTDRGDACVGRPALPVAEIRGARRRRLLALGDPGRATRLLRRQDVRQPGDRRADRNGACSGDHRCSRGDAPGLACTSPDS
jgi:hypothetical protein